MRKNRLEHYGTRRTITFNINKITKYERPAVECPRPVALLHLSRGTRSPPRTLAEFIRFILYTYNAF